jgi:hypothetical protein
MIATLRDFDVSGVFRSGKDARRPFVIEECGRRRGQGGEDTLDCFEYALDFAGADDGVHFRDLLENLLAVALDKAARYDQFPRGAELFVLRHLDDGFHGLFLSRFDETAGIDDEDFGFVGAGCKFAAAARENAHHDLTFIEVRFVFRRDGRFWIGRLPQPS